MVQVVGRVWIWLWASDLENQGIQSKSQPASFSLLWLSPQTINGSCFLKASPDFLKTCSSLLKFTKGMFQMKALLFFPVPSFLEHLLCKQSNSLGWVRATLAEYMSCPSLHISTRLPRWIAVWLAIGHMSKTSYSGSTPWKDLPTGLLNMSRITGIKS